MKTAQIVDAQNSLNAEDLYALHALAFIEMSTLTLRTYYLLHVEI